MLKQGRAALALKSRNQAPGAAFKSGADAAEARALMRAGGDVGHGVDGGLSGKLGNGAQDNPDGGPGMGREGAVHQLVGLKLPEQFVFERVEADLDLAIPVVAEFVREVFELVLQPLFFGGGGVLGFLFFQEIENQGLGGIVQHQGGELFENLLRRAADPGLPRRQ